MNVPATKDHIEKFRSTTGKLFQSDESEDKVQIEAPRATIVSLVYILVDLFKIYKTCVCVKTELYDPAIKQGGCDGFEIHNKG